MITGGLPESGFRVELERGAEGPPFVYRGRLALPEAFYDLRVEVGTDKQVGVTLALPEAHPEAGSLPEKIRLLVRTVVRQTEESGAAPARKIVRWRGEK